MSRPFLESELCTAYEEQARYYAQALAAAERLAPALREGKSAAGPSAHDVLDQIVALLGQISEVESRIAPVKKCWHETGQKPGPALDDLLSRIETMIKALRA